MEEGDVSTVCGRWSRGGQNNRDKRGCHFHRLFINTWNVVQSNWVLSVGTVLSFLRAQRCIKIQKSPVCFCKLQRGLVGPDEEGRFLFFFYTLQRHILFSCCQGNKKSSLQDPWCWWWQKKQTRKKYESKTKRVVVPNMTMQMPPHRHHLVLVEVQALGKVDHRNNSQMDACRIRSKGLDFSEKWHW